MRGVVGLVVVAVLLVGAMLWLSGRVREQPQVRVEKAVPLNDASR